MMIAGMEKEIDEKYFFEFAATVLRAGSEMDYIRQKGAPDGKRDRRQAIEPGEATWKTAEAFCEGLEKCGIDYRVIELHDRLATLIVNPQDFELFRGYVEDNRDLQKLQHPYGELFQYRFLQQMRPFELLKYQDTFFEIYFQLPCRSTASRTWIPFDGIVQQRIWKADTRGTHMEELDSIARYVYRLCWCIFVNRAFADADEVFFDRNVNLLAEKEMADCLATVFFKYTARLTELLKKGEYSSLISDYYAFDQY